MTNEQKKMIKEYLLDETFSSRPYGDDDWREYFSKSKKDLNETFFLIEEFELEDVKTIRNKLDSQLCSLIGLFGKLKDA